MSVFTFLKSKYSIKNYPFFTLNTQSLKQLSVFSKYEVNPKV